MCHYTFHLGPPFKDFGPKCVPCASKSRFGRHVNRRPTNINLGSLSGAINAKSVAEVAKMMSWAPLKRLGSPNGIQSPPKRLRLVTGDEFSSVFIGLREHVVGRDAGDSIRNSNVQAKA